MKLPIFLAISSLALALPATAFAESMTTVKVETDEEVRFEHRAGENDDWMLVCNAPCQKSVPSGDEFRFAGTDDANPTKPFSLRTDQADQHGLVTVQHHRNSLAMYRAAPFLIAGAAAVFIGGIVMAAIGITKAHGHLADGSTEQTNALTGAGTFLILGGVGLGYYGVSARVNDKYSVATGDLRTLEPAQTKGQTSSVRGTAFFVPIFSGRF